VSKYPPIPDFGDTPASMMATLRAIKDSVEMLTGQRQGPSLGAPSVYVQVDTPTLARATMFSKGDFWIHEETFVLSYWNGQQWVLIA
jgi:hypothetical protein